MPKTHWDLFISKSCPMLVLQKVQQHQHKIPCNSQTIILTWPQKSGSLEWQVCNDFMVLAGIAGTIAAFTLVMYLRDLLLKREFWRRIAKGCLLQMIFPICQLSEVPCNVCEVVRLFHWNVAAVFCKMDNNSPKFRDLLIEKGSLFREGLEEWISTKSFS